MMRKIYVEVAIMMILTFLIIEMVINYILYFNDLLNSQHYEKIEDIFVVLTYLRDHYNYLNYNNILLNILKNRVAYNKYEFTFYPNMTLLNQYYLLFANIHMKIHGDSFIGSLVIPLISFQSNLKIDTSCMFPQLKNEKNQQGFTADVSVYVNRLKSLDNLTIYIQIIKGENKTSRRLVNITQYNLFTQYNQGILEINMKNFGSYITIIFDDILSVTNNTLPSKINIYIFCDARDLYVLKPWIDYSVYNEKQSDKNITLICANKKLMDVHVYPVFIIKDCMLKKLLSFYNGWIDFILLFIIYAFLFLNMYLSLVYYKSSTSKVPDYFNVLISILLFIITLITLFSKSILSPSLIFLKIVSILLTVFSLGIGEFWFHKLLVFVRGKRLNKTEFKLVKIMRLLCYVMFGIFLIIIIFIFSASACIYFIYSDDLIPLPNLINWFGIFLFHKIINSTTSFAFLVLYLFFFFKYSILASAIYVLTFIFKLYIKRIKK